MPTDATHDAARQAASLLSTLGIHLPPRVEDLVVAGMMLTAFCLVALCAYLFLRTLAQRCEARDAGSRAGLVIRRFTGPAVWLILLTGVMAMLVSLDALVSMRGAILRVYGALTAVTGVVVGLRLVSLLLDWSFQRLEPRLGSTTHHYAALSRKVVTVIVWAVGGILVLGQLGLEITPLLTTLGLGSLAVALALQDTLANFFAGIYLMLDRPIRVGDYVRLDTGDEGFVDAIGWRSTHIRLWSNYIVVIPNTRLTSSIITNLVLNQSETSVYIHGGVGYLNDLEHVERVLIEVAHETQERVDGAVTGAEPLIRFQEFGDSNITFLAILKVSEFAYQYVLKHEFIKAVHRRFREEGIEIAWPVRQLVVSQPLPVRVMAGTGSERPGAAAVLGPNEEFLA
ncbi:MAG: mechanosensitive ion channel family protein [Armatimonadota bacterium]